MYFCISSFKSDNELSNSFKISSFSFSGIDLKAFSFSYNYPLKPIKSFVSAYSDSVTSSMPFNSDKALAKLDKVCN